MFQRVKKEIENLALLLRHGSWMKPWRQLAMLLAFILSNACLLSPEIDEEIISNVNDPPEVVLERLCPPDDGAIYVSEESKCDNLYFKFGIRDLNVDDYLLYWWGVDWDRNESADCSLLQINPSNNVDRGEIRRETPYHFSSEYEWHTMKLFLIDRHFKKSSCTEVDEAEGKKVTYQWTFRRLKPGEIPPNGKIPFGDCDCSITQ
jgi:hypothetical protein